MSGFLNQPVSPKRDLRVDFFRGLALYMVFLDHVVGDPFARFTYHAIGFSDAAEIFVFLSGLACGSVYSKTLWSRGWRGLFSAVAKRSLRIYLFYAAAGVTIVLLATMSANLWNVSDLRFTLGFAANRPFTALLLMLGLIWSPSDAGILSLYIIFALAVIPATLFGLKRSGYLTLALSGALWLFSGQAMQVVYPMFSEWYLNPFAWQFLLVIGMYFGVARTISTAAPPGLSAVRRMLPVAAIIVVAALVYKLAVFGGSAFGVDTAGWRFSEATLEAQKTHLSALRLVHFLSVALIVAVAVPTNWRPLSWLPSRLVIWTGRQSLEIYSISVVCDTIDSMTVLALHPTLAERLLIDCAGIAMMASAAAVLNWRRAKLIATSGTGTLPLDNLNRGQP